MILDLGWRDTYRLDVLPRLATAHKDLTNMEAALRNVSVDVWTESPSDLDKLTAGRSHYSLEGWRSHFKRERARLVAFSTDHGAALQGFDAGGKAALDGYLASTATLATSFNTLAAHANYRDANGNTIQRLVTQAHRNALADAIGAELE